MQQYQIKILKVNLYQVTNSILSPTLPLSPSLPLPLSSFRPLLQLSRLLLLKMFQDFNSFFYWRVCCEEVGK